MFKSIFYEQPRQHADSPAILERRNIKLRSVVSNVNTQSAMNIIEAIAEGEQDVEKLVSLCKGKLKKKKNERRKALVGVIPQHDRDMLAALLRDIRHYQPQIADIEEKIRKHTEHIPEHRSLIKPR